MRTAVVANGREADVATTTVGPRDATRDRHYLDRIKQRHEKVLGRYRALTEDLDDRLPEGRRSGRQDRGGGQQPHSKPAQGGGNQDIGEDGREQGRLSVCVHDEPPLRTIIGKAPTPVSGPRCGRR